jgi:hypothetical protein
LREANLQHEGWKWTVTRHESEEMLTAEGDNQTDVGQSYWRIFSDEEENQYHQGRSCQHPLEETCPLAQNGSELREGESSLTYMPLEEKTGEQS